jgi:Lrp/AsnC family transcriptional regulator, leucine-responsive regulatory protein
LPAEDNLFIPLRRSSALDALDREIISFLRLNGRMSHEQISQQVNLSRPAVHERIKRLEEQGIIRGYQALVDWSALGLPLTAFIWVRTTGASCNEIGQALLRLSDTDAIVQECYRVTGEWCMLLKTQLASPLALEALLDRIRTVPNVQETMTILALSALNETGLNGPGKASRS